MREMTVYRFACRLLLPFAAVLALALIAWPLTTGVAQEKAKDPAKSQWQKIVEASKTERISGRRNGVLLRAEVDVKKDPKGHVVLFQWFLDYNGPRPPLTIFRPSLDIHAYGQCWVNFLLIDTDEVAENVAIRPAVEDVEPTLVSHILANPEKSHFHTIQKNEIAKGTIEVAMKRMAAQARVLFPDKSRKFPSSRLYAQIEFRPDERGARFDFDAWTGELRTPLMAVPLEKLTKD